jgi:hypothetical protein
MDMEAVNMSLYDGIDQFTTMLRDHVCPTGACRPNDDTGRMCATCFHHCVPSTAMVVADETVVYAESHRVLMLEETNTRLREHVGQLQGLLDQGRLSFETANKCFTEALEGKTRVIDAYKVDAADWEQSCNKKDRQLQAALAELAKK